MSFNVSVLATPDPEVFMETNGEIRYEISSETQLVVLECENTFLPTDDLRVFLSIDEQWRAGEPGRDSGRLLIAGGEPLRLSLRLYALSEQGLMIENQSNAYFGENAKVHLLALPQNHFDWGIGAQKNLKGTEYVEEFRLIRQEDPKPPVARSRVASIRMAFHRFGSESVLRERAKFERVRDARDKDLLNLSHLQQTSNRF